MKPSRAATPWLFLAPALALFGFESSEQTSSEPMVAFA